MTKDPEDDNNNIVHLSSRLRMPTNLDPRVVAICELLAKRAAEEDFYKQVMAPYLEKAPAEQGEEE